MAKDLYLIRKMGTFAPYESVESVTLTSNGIADYTGVTGVASTNVITVLNFTPQNGDPFFFTAKTGGSGLTTGATYYFGDVSGSTFKAYTAASGGTVVPLTTNITAGTIRVLTDDLRVWSAEFRDQFTQTGDGWAGLGQYSSAPGNDLTGADDVPGQSGLVILPGPLSVTALGAAGSSTGVKIGATVVSSTLSDELAHSPLRQTLLKRTHWRFEIADFGSIYATWADGDIIATGPPNTVIEN